DHIDNESRQVLLGQPFIHRGRKQIPRLPIDRPEIAHAAQFVVDRESVLRFYPADRLPSSTNCSRPTKSDRLLETVSFLTRKIGTFLLRHCVALPFGWQPLYR